MNDLKNNVGGAVAPSQNEDIFFFEYLTNIRHYAKNIIGDF